MVWTVSEIAQATGLTRTHVARLIKKGAIKGERKQAGWLVDDEEANRFIQDRKEHKDLRFKRNQSE
jgi:excisionase family DNA binding protein